MRRQLGDEIRACELLIQQAVDGFRRYESAQSNGVSAEEAERLRVLAESLFQAVTEYHLRATGSISSTLH